MKFKNSASRIMSKAQLAEAYDVSTKTLATWLKMIGIETGKRRIFTPKELAQIFDQLGTP